VPANSRFSNISFTPVEKQVEKKIVPFRDATVVRFFDLTDEFFEHEQDVINRFTAFGATEIAIRIEPSEMGGIPTFDKGEIGTFSCVYTETGLMISAVNARVDASSQRALVLEAYSVDGVTGTITLSRS
jgi:hypothetical protein